MTLRELIDRELAGRRMSAKTYATTLEQALQLQVALTAMLRDLAAMALAGKSRGLSDELVRGISHIALDEALSEPTTEELQSLWELSSDAPEALEDWRDE